MPVFSALPTMLLSYELGPGVLIHSKYQFSYVVHGHRPK